MPVRAQTIAIPPLVRLPTRQLQISSVLARRIVDAACRTARLPVSQELATAAADMAVDKYLDANLTPDRLTQRLEIRARLEASGLALLLPGGLENLPDIYSALPVTLARLARLLRPRTPEQLISHLAANLDWYLNPGSSPLRRFRLADMCGSPLFVVVFAVWCALLGHSLEWLEDWQVWVGTFVMIAGLFGFLLRLGLDNERLRDRYNALELYLYLREAYRDAPEPRR